METQEGYIKIQAYKTNRAWIRWLVPVRRVTIEMVFDVHAWVFMSSGVGLPFSDFDKIPPEEYLVWAMYGGSASHASVKGKRGMKVEQIQELIRGIITEDRVKIFEVINSSRLYGKTIQEYAEAADAKGSKKAALSDQKN